MKISACVFALRNDFTILPHLCSSNSFIWHLFQLINVFVLDGCISYVDIFKYISNDQVAGNKLHKWN